MGIHTSRQQGPEPGQPRGRYQLWCILDFLSMHRLVLLSALETTHHFAVVAIRRGITPPPPPRYRRMNIFSPYLDCLRYRSNSDLPGDY